MRAQVHLRLVGNPHLAAIDRIVELAEQRQAPLRVLEPRGIMIFPPKALGRRLIGGDTRAVEPVGERPPAADFDAEADGEVERLAVDPGRAAEQCGERFDVMADRGAGRHGPGEYTLIAMIDGRYFRTDFEPRDDLVDQ